MDLQRSDPPQRPSSFIRFFPREGEIDKNSLLGELNIQKRELCVEVILAILAQDLGFVRGLFAWDAGDFRGRGGEGRFHRFAEVRQVFLRLIRTHRFLPPPIPHLFLRLKVSIPGVVRVPIKVIVIHGDLREMIQDVSGRA